MASLLRPEAGRGDEHPIVGGRDARGDMLEVKEPCELVEPLVVAEMGLSLGFLEERCVHAEVHSAEQREDLVANRLGILGCMEDAVEMHSLPPELTPELQQLVADMALVGRHGADDEVARCARVPREVEVPGLIGEDVAVAHAA